MKITRGYKTEPDLNDKQTTLCLKHAGTARFAFNWGLAKKIEAYKKGEKVPTGIDLHRALNKLKHTELQWMYEVSKCAPQEALRDVDVADVHILSATVSEQAGRWYVSLQVEEEQPEPVNVNVPAIGVDVGVRVLATLSDATPFDNPRALKGQLKKLKKLQRAYSRKQQGSKNKEKSRKKLAKLHARIAHIRKDSTHKLTSYLCKNHAVVAIEDLHVAGMLKNHHLAQAIADSSFGEMRRQLTYKALWYGTQVVPIDRW